jgi:hypothetical protein
VKYLDLDALPSYTKQQLASHQLDRAIKLLLDENDAISAITLAGAAEEILGEMVKHQGGVSAHQELIDECVAVGRARLDEKFKPSEFHEIFAFYRNELKHLRDESDITVTAACAYPVIERAIQNLRYLSFPDSEQIKRYMARAYS